MMPDVLVLGAGPAGIAVSILLARKGFTVEILDSAFFPRTKICGEFLNPQAVQWLKDRSASVVIRQSHHHTHGECAAPTSSC